jgi:hypothetical protein
MTLEKIHLAPLVAILMANAAPAAAQFPTFNAAPQGNACGQYTPCCPPATKISRDGDWKADQQVAGNITSNYRLKYTMQPQLKAQLGAFSNYVAATSPGFTNTNLVTTIWEAGSGPSPIPSFWVTDRADIFISPWIDTPSHTLSYGHGISPNYPLSVNKWYVIESRFIANKPPHIELECGVQKFAYRVEYKPMKTLPGAPLGPSVTIIPYNGTVPKAPIPQMPKR